MVSESNLTRTEPSTRGKTTEKNPQAPG